MNVWFLVIINSDVYYDLGIIHYSVVYDLVITYYNCYFGYNRKNFSYTSNDIWFMIYCGVNYGILWLLF